MNGEKNKEQPILDRPQEIKRPQQPQPDLDMPKAVQDKRPEKRSRESKLAQYILYTLFCHHKQNPGRWFWGAWLLGRLLPKHKMGSDIGIIAATYSKKRIQKAVRYLGKIGFVQVKKHPDPNKIYPEEKNIKPGAQRITLFNKLVSVNRMYLTKNGYLAHKLKIPIYLSNPDETLNLLHGVAGSTEKYHKKKWRKLAADLDKFPGYSEKLPEVPKEPYKRASSMKSNKKLGPVPKEPYKDTERPLLRNDNEGVARLYGSHYYNNKGAELNSAPFLESETCVDGKQTTACHQHRDIPLREPALGSLPSGDAVLHHHNNKPDGKSIEIEKMLARRNKFYKAKIASQLAKGRTEEQLHREMLDIYEGKRRKP